MAYLLTIQERGHSWAGRSPIESKHTTFAEAKATLCAYVLVNWDEEDLGPIPEDDDTMIESYFSNVLETYEIKEV